MISYNVNIPDEKQSFFQEFLDLMGAKYERNQEQNLMSEEQKKILLQRLNADKSEFISARTSLNELRKKHGL